MGGSMRRAYSLIDIGSKEESALCTWLGYSG
jgi:hypothetical protein